MTMKERAASAARIIKIYRTYPGPMAEDPSEALRQLLCDLLFWALREGVDFPAALRLAIQTRDSEYLKEHLDLVGGE